MSDEELDQLLPLTDLSLNILLALGRGPLHGYGIIKDIEDRTGASANLRSGTLYLAIRRLRDDDLVAPSVAPPGAEADARRNYFAMTDRGRRLAALELRRLRELVAVGTARRLVDAEGAA